MNKFNLIFLIGNEGTGHHLYDDICNYKETHQLHQLLMIYFDNLITPEYRLHVKKLIFEYTQNHKGENHMETASFPFFRPTSPLQTYDILGFYELFSNMDHVNLFFIVSTRDIIISTLSAHRRMDYDKSIFYTARMQEFCLLYINNQLQCIPEDMYIVLNFNYICNNVKTCQNIIREKSKMSTLSFDETKVKIPNDSKYLQYSNYNVLMNFFNENRLNQFNFLKHHELKTIPS